MRGPSVAGDNRVLATSIPSRRLTILELVLVDLDVASAADLLIAEGTNKTGALKFVARSKSRSRRIDRRLAIALRLDGARWHGPVMRDPCAVA